jgi:hypothetical protein
MAKETPKKSATQPKTPLRAKSRKVARGPKESPPKDAVPSHVEEPTSRFKPLKNRIRVKPSTGRPRKVRVRFPRALLARDANGGKLDSELGEFVRATFDSRTATSPNATPPIPLIGRSISVPTASAEAIVAWEKGAENDLDRLLYSALVK